MILQKQVCKVCSPFLIGMIHCEILLQLVFKYLVWIPVHIIQLPWGDACFRDSMLNSDALVNAPLFFVVTNDFFSCIQVYNLAA